MAEKRVTRREFIQDTTAAVAGTALGTGLALQSATAAAAPDPRKTRSYNPDMEYRRLGRTGLMLSAVSMGGHWKRIPYAHGSDDAEKEIELPRRLDPAAEDKPDPQEKRSEQEDPSRTPSIHQVSNERADDPVEDPKERERPRCQRTTPAKFLKKGNKENRKGVHDRICQGERAETDSDDDPSEGKASLTFHVTIIHSSFPMSRRRPEEI